MADSGVTMPTMGGTRGALAQYVRCATGRSLGEANEQDWLRATAMLVRDRLAERWVGNAGAPRPRGVKRVCYLSMEFLLGRLLVDTLLNLDLYDSCRAALEEVGLDITELAELESEPGLGNGGLGRLAACLLDSAATIGIPVYGYGIRYDCGAFAQRIEDGWQVEQPDHWLRHGNLWEFARSELRYVVPFGGRIRQNPAASARLTHEWVDTESVLATAYDLPIAGYGNSHVNTLRLWSARAPAELDLHSFNNGDHHAAVEQKNQIENLSRVLYPSDSSPSGQALRFKQEYFFVSASIQDILRRFRRNHISFDRLPEKLTIQINDTHPALAVAEMMRLLVDRHHLEWDRAWDITRRTFAYTNHTLMPEALETWPVRLFEALLPRHLEIIYLINDQFLRDVARRRPGDSDAIRRLSLIDEDGERRVRMAHLTFVGAHKVNGVSQIHTQLMRTSCFPDFDRLYPGRIVNVTNGISLRRWLGQANPPLAELVQSRLGWRWMTDPEALKMLAEYASDAEFAAAFRRAKQANKERFAEHLANACGIVVDPHSLFDVQVKRIHEYKRQLLNVLHVIALYNRIRAGGAEQHVPRTVIFAGKAAPGYAMAKLIVKLIHDVAAVVNADPIVSPRLKVVFVPNYGVAAAERIIPAADLSEQISTAGFEASGTGNMKFALNGALTIGTLDGANIEIRNAVGADAFFAFGLSAERVARLRTDGYDPWVHYHNCAELRQALDMMGDGHFSPEEPARFRPIFDALTSGGDRYFLLADFVDYVACHKAAEALYCDLGAWTRRAILNVSGMGRFSSDRTVRDYVGSVWGGDQVSRRENGAKHVHYKLAATGG